MAEDEDGGPRPVMSDVDEASSGPDAAPKALGWYPSRSSPSDQMYWDGHDWTARRRWTTGKGWVVAGDAPPEVAFQDTSPAPPGPRLSANPYASVVPRRATSTGFTFNVGLLLLLVCGIALMYGSVGAWVHVSGSVGIADFRVSVNGIDPGVSTLIGINGWVTFIGGILVVIFACFEMTSEELQLGIMTTLVAAVTAIFAIYDMFRIVQKISQVPASLSADVSVGWGLICVLSAAALATLIALVRLLQH
jgi:hypothetical protein